MTIAARRVGPFPWLACCWNRQCPNWHLVPDFGVRAKHQRRLCCDDIIDHHGAMHADGLADCADGFWGGWTIERRLEIMKDSHIGAYGVIALILIIGLQWQIVAALMQAEIAFIALISAAVLSRAPLPLIMARIPNARGSGLSHQTADVGSKRRLWRIGAGGGYCLGHDGHFGRMGDWLRRGDRRCRDRTCQMENRGTRATPWGQHRCWAKHSHCWLPFNFCIKNPRCRGFSETI